MNSTLSNPRKKIKFQRITMSSKVVELLKQCVKFSQTSSGFAQNLRNVSFNTRIQIYSRHLRTANMNTMDSSEN